MTKLERAALQAQMNPHFIFNCLNSIQNFILQNDTQKAVEFLSRFARLVRLNLNASVEGVISLEEEIKLLDNYLALEQERFDHRFDYQIEMEEGLEDMDLELPPMLIQPFVENAIVHGISKQEGQGKVQIKITKEQGHLLVKVQDNGTGHTTKPSANDSAKHKSVGMSITRKRLGLLDAALSDTIKITTLQDQNGDCIGTEVSFHIKINSLD